MPDFAKTDPYQTPVDVPDEAGVSLPRKLAALAFGVVVAISAAATLSAFLFGILVAVGGRFQTAPVDLSGLTATSTGLAITLIGFVCIFVIAILLGGFATRKVLLASQKTLMCEYRRKQLNDLARNFRTEIENSRLLASTAKIGAAVPFVDDVAHQQRAVKVD